MSPGTDDSRRCSREFAPASAFRPDVSRGLLAWWVAVHCAAALGFVAAFGAVAPLQGAAALALGVHAWFRRPRRPPLLWLGANDRWAAPELGLFDLEPASGARFSTWWIRLVLTSEQGGLSVVLLRDQLDRRSWWTLQAALRGRARRTAAVSGSPRGARLE